MDIINLLISLVSGIVGGNIAGAATPSKSLGWLGNSLTGLFGGGIGGIILQLIGMFNQPGGEIDISHLNIEQILANVGTSGVGGAALMLIVGLIKGAMSKKSSDK
jgi:uncharacterized membrane protein YeaQ/YmgE (transglycosylase-associated protein family)